MLDKLDFTIRIGSMPTFIISICLNNIYINKLICMVPLSMQLKGQCHNTRMRQFHVFPQLHASYTQAMYQSHCQNNLWKT